MLKFFLTKPNMTGAICSSSPYLAQMITREIGLESSAAVAEIGPGTGAFTGEIIRSIPNDSKFFCVELNADLIPILQERFSGLDVCCGSASDLPKFLGERHITALDAVVSGLPWALFDDDLQNSILDAIVASLKPGGYFATFSYLKPPFPKDLKFRNKLSRYFTKIERSEIVWRNLPPAFVFRCQK